MEIKAPQIIWLVILTLFIGLQVYHLSVGNYFDIIISILTVIIVLLLIGAYCLIAKKLKQTE